MTTLEGVDSAVFADMKALLEGFASRVPVRSVTVIGNAPLEPDDDRVKVIETSDLVFRCNSFVLDEPGEQPRLGRKTDVVVAARGARITPWFFRDYPRRAYLIMDAGNVHKSKSPSTPRNWPDDLAAWPIPNRLFGWPLKRLLRPEKDGRGAVPSTGTGAAYVAHQLFPDAQLYLAGFSFIEFPDQTTWKHQWGTECRVHPSHKIDREGALLQSWVDDGSAILLP